MKIQYIMLIIMLIRFFLSFSFLRKFFLLQIIKILIKGAFKYIILIALYPIGVVARGEKR